MGGERGIGGSTEVIRHVWISVDHNFESSVHLAGTSVCSICYHLVIISYYLQKQRRRREQKKDREKEDAKEREDVR